MGVGVGEGQLPPYQILLEEFSRRRAKNSRYSLRAFSQLLEMSSGRVSQLLNQKRNFTPAMGEKIALRLGMSPRQSQSFLESIEASRARRFKSAGRSRIPKQKIALKQSQFEIISEPYHFSLLSLMETFDFKDDISWMAMRLNLNVVQVKAALERLKSLGLIEPNVDGKWSIVAEGGIKSTDDVVNPALRKAHATILEHTIETLEDIPLELRDITSLTMAVDPTKLSQAKQLIRKFKQEMENLLESGTKSEVYRFNVQLIPESQRES